MQSVQIDTGPELYRRPARVTTRWVREGEDGVAAGMVPVLAERAALEGPRSTRAVETTPAASQVEY